MTINYIMIILQNKHNINKKNINMKKKQKRCICFMEILVSYLCKFKNTRIQYVQKYY